MRVLSYDGTWEAIYCNGELIAQGPAVSAIQLLRALNLDVTVVNDVSEPLPWPDFIDSSYNPRHSH
jgi:hypothetical protein